MVFANTKLQAEVKHIASLWENPVTRRSAEQLAGKIAHDYIDQLVSLARTNESAQTVLFIKYEPLIGALTSEVIGRGRAQVWSDQEERQQLRLYARTLTDQDFSNAGIDRESLRQEIRVQLQALMNSFDPNKAGFNGYVNDYLPVRVLGWLRRQMMRKIGSKLVPKHPRGSQVDLDPDMVKGPDADWIGDAQVLGTRLFNAETVRRYLLAVLVDADVMSAAPKNLPTFVELLQRAAVAHCRLDPVLIPGTLRYANLLAQGGKLIQDSARYRQRRGSILPLYVPDDMGLRGYLMSADGSHDLNRARAIYPDDRAWEALKVLYQSGHIVRQAEVAGRLGLSKQRVSNLRRAGIRRLIRLGLIAVCWDEGIERVVVYEKSEAVE